MVSLRRSDVGVSLGDVGGERVRGGDGEREWDGEGRVYRRWFPMSLPWLLVWGVATWSIEEDVRFKGSGEAVT